MYIRDIPEDSVKSGTVVLENPDTGEIADIIPPKKSNSKIEFIKASNELYELIKKPLIELSSLLKYSSSTIKVKPVKKYIRFKDGSVITIEHYNRIKLAFNTCKNKNDQYIVKLRFSLLKDGDTTLYQQRLYNYNKGETNK